MDGRLLVVGSMNLDLRSQLQNSEVAIAIRSAALSAEAAHLIEPTLQQGAYHVGLTENGLIWRAPQGSGLQDSTTEPDASIVLKLMPRLNLVEEFAAFRREMEEVLAAMEIGDLESIGHIRRSHISMSFARMMRYAGHAALPAGDGPGTIRQ